MASTSPDRIVTLDIIRGIAVMGIFSVNIIAFAMIEGAYGNPAAYGGWHGADLFVWAANLVVIDGKMRTLFSMLFGASTLLVIERAEAAGLSGAKVHVRRMLVLLGFGLAHFYLVWFGDILTLYAVSGLIAFLFRKLPVERLIALGMAFLLGSMLLFGGFMFSQYQADIAAHAPNAAQAAIKEWNDGLGSFYPGIGKVTADMALHLGPWLGLVTHNLREWAEIIPSTLAFMPDTIGLMLLGMAGYKSGFLIGQWDDRAYRKVAWIGLGTGLTAFAGLAALAWQANFAPLEFMIANRVAAPPLRPVTAVGFIALFILMFRNGSAIRDRFAAVGRTAFSNYLGCTIIGTCIFYGFGGDLYAQVSRGQAWLLVPPVWAVMLLWPKPWLERFNYGPFEWLWRSLARGKLQPMRKRQPEPVAAPAEA